MRNIIAVLFWLSVLVCDKKEEYLPKVFNNNPSLLGDKVSYDNLSFILPNNLKRISPEQLEELKLRTGRIENKFYKTTLIDVFESDGDMYGFSFSKVNEKSLMTIENDDYLKMLVESFKTEKVFRIKFLLNDIPTVQFQINHPNYIELKLFLGYESQFFLLDFIVDRKIFYDKINYIESTLSTITIN